MFATDEQCAAYLFKVRWPHGYMCPTCGTDKAWKVDDLWTMHCRNNHKITVTAGTTLHRSKQPLTTWFHAAWLVSTLTPGISAVQFQRQLGIKRYETAFQLLHKLRSALVAPDREPLSGNYPFLRATAIAIPTSDTAVAAQIQTREGVEATTPAPLPRKLPIRRAKSA